VSYCTLMDTTRTNQARSFFLPCILTPTMPTPYSSADSTIPQLDLPFLFTPLTNYLPNSSTDPSRNANGQLRRRTRSTTSASEPSSPRSQPTSPSPMSSPGRSRSPRPRSGSLSASPSQLQFVGSQRRSNTEPGSYVPVIGPRSLSLHDFSVLAQAQAQVHAATRRDREVNGEWDPPPRYTSHSEGEETETRDLDDDEDAPLLFGRRRRRHSNGNSSYSFGRGRGFFSSRIPPRRPPTAHADSEADEVVVAAVCALCSI
jgi:hypothetical protein